MFISKGYKGIYDLYFTHPFSGKRSKVSTGTPVFKQAKRFQERFIPEEYISPQVSIRRPQIFNLEDLKEVVLDYARTNYSGKTLELYKLSFGALIRIIGNKPIAHCRLRDFELFKAKRAQEVSRTTVNMQTRTIKAIFGIALNLGYVDQNPTKGLTQLSIPEKDKLNFSNDDLNRLLKAIDKPVLKDIVVFTLYTGCRLAEVLNVQRKDVDFEQGIIAIRNKPNFKTKTGRIRLLPIPDALRGLLQKFKDANQDDYLFSKEDGFRFCPTHISRSFKKFVRKAGLEEKFHFHCLRHTFITKLIKNGVNINYVKELAGHSEIQTTMGYIHIEVEDMRKAVNTLKIAI